MALFFGKYWPHLIGAALLTALLIVVNNWREDSKKLDSVQQEYKLYRERVETAAETKKEVLDGFQNELASIRGAISKQPAPVVRMCYPASVPDNRPTVGDHGATTATGIVSERDDMHLEAGPDLGPSLYGISDRADILSAQLRACQGYILKLQEQSK